MKLPAFERLLEVSEDPVRWQAYKRSLFIEAKRENPAMTNEQLENHWRFACFQFGFDIGEPVEFDGDCVVAPAVVGDNFLPIDFHENLDEHGNYVGAPFSPNTEPN